MSFIDFINNNIVILDGGTGSLLQKNGLKAGERPEYWGLTNADKMVEIHKSYFDAGSNIVNTNTFGLNSFNFTAEEQEKIAEAAVNNVRRAAELSTGKQQKFVSYDIGPSGKMLKPLGDVDFEDAVEVFAVQAKLAEKYGADLITIETFTDSYETKAALLAVKENCSLPVFVTNAYNSDDNLLTGASPEAMVAMLESSGADAIGLNCSYGPDQLKNVINRILKVASVPVIFKPNAGLPVVVDGVASYDITPEEFSVSVADAVKSGVNIVGGCCGTTPEYISLLADAVSSLRHTPVTDKNITVASCNTHSVEFNSVPVIIGERINPTGKKAVKAALKEKNYDFLVREGLNQLDAGAHILDVNCGLPDIDEKAVLTELVTKLQNVCDAPLQLDSSDPVTLESALRIYNGKPVINSVNGKAESLNSVLPLVKKYGGLLVALTLDESGIPDTAQGRLEIAQRILTEAEKYGISKKNIIFDPLCMAVSSDDTAAKVTLDSVKLITEITGCKTILGVSNVSFGLPEREKINSAFFNLALFNGLSSAIINPLSVPMMDTYYSNLVIRGLDNSCLNYINHISTSDKDTNTVNTADDGSTPDAIINGIISGRKEYAASMTGKFIETVEPVGLINKYIVPALDEIGVRFENKKAFLPQLMLAAEAAKACFDVVKSKCKNNNSSEKLTIVIATVKGDIHDIGKNIVRMLLENYGYNVIDLGKDVPAETIVDTAKESGAAIVGLSALMTTTLPAMKETALLIHERLPEVKVVVGGAVLTEEYADSIGAVYSSDAMETVRFAESLLK